MGVYEGIVLRIDGQPLTEAVECFPDGGEIIRDVEILRFQYHFVD